MNKRLITLTSLILCVTLLFGCAARPEHERSSTSSQGSSGHSDSSSANPSSSSGVSSGQSNTPTAPTPEELAQKTMQDMTLEQKIGQMFFLAYREDANGKPLLVLDDPSIQQIKSIQPGGVVLFGENIGTIEQIRTFLKTAQQSISLPAFFSIDQEGGAVQRIKNTANIPATNVPNMYQVGLTGEPALARAVGEVLGSELSVFGFNMDFAPDCDVFSNPNNTVIGHRSFSSDPKVVAEMSIQLSEGMRNAGLVPVCKHFPGHGDTDADTHVGFAISNKTLDALKKTELVPFAAQINAGAEMVMVAHISLPQINGDNTPATLSKKVVTDLLRNEMGFDGITITDSMAMGAIVKNYGSADAAVRAVQAGMDMLLMPENPNAAFSALVKAVKEGKITEERIDESVMRILTLKYQYGLFEEKELPGVELLGSEEHIAIIRQIPKA